MSERKPRRKGDEAIKEKEVRDAKKMDLPPIREGASASESDEEDNVPAEPDCQDCADLADMCSEDPFRRSRTSWRGGRRESISLYTSPPPAWSERFTLHREMVLEEVAPTSSVANPERDDASGDGDTYSCCCIENDDTQSGNMADRSDSEDEVEEVTSTMKETSCTTRPSLEPDLQNSESAETKRRISNALKKATVTVNSAIKSFYSPRVKDELKGEKEEDTPAAGGTKEKAPLSTLAARKFLELSMGTMAGIIHVTPVASGQDTETPLQDAKEESSSEKPLDEDSLYLQQIYRYCNNMQTRQQDAGGANESDPNPKGNSTQATAGNSSVSTPTDTDTADMTKDGGQQQRKQEENTSEESESNESEGAQGQCVARGTNTSPSFLEGIISQKLTADMQKDIVSETEEPCEHVWANVRTRETPIPDLDSPENMFAQCFDPTKIVAPSNQEGETILRGVVAEDENDHCGKFYMAQSVSNYYEDDGFFPTYNAVSSNDAMQENMVSTGEERGESVDPFPAGAEAQEMITQKSDPKDKDLLGGSSDVDVYEKFAADIAANIMPTNK